MTSPQEETLRSSLISVWLNPRDTIERIIATHPGRGVLLLASFGGLSGIVRQLIDFGVTSELLDWRVLLGGSPCRQPHWNCQSLCCRALRRLDRAHDGKQRTSVGAARCPRPELDTCHSWTRRRFVDHRRHACPRS